MTDQELDAIAARLKATTAGEWLTETSDTGTRVWAHGLSVACFYIWEPGDKHADTKFVTEAHNHDIPALLAEVRWLRLAKAGEEAMSFSLEQRNGKLEAEVRRLRLRIAELRLKNVT